MYNFGDEPQTFKRGDKIAQLVIENALQLDTLEVDNLVPTSGGEQGFGSTDIRPLMNYPPDPMAPTTDPHIPTPSEPPKPCQPIVTALEKEAITADIHITYQPPYNLGFSSLPLDNQTFRTVSTFGEDKSLGFDLHTCPHFGIPKINDCKQWFPCARLPRW